MFHEYYFRVRCGFENQFELPEFCKDAGEELSIVQNDLHVFAYKAFDRTGMVGGLTRGFGLSYIGL